MSILKFEVVISGGCMAVEWNARAFFDQTEVQAVADKLLAHCIELSDRMYAREVGLS